MRDKYAFYINLSMFSDERKLEAKRKIFTAIQTYINNEDKKENVRILLNPQNILDSNIILICKEINMPVKILGFDTDNQKEFIYYKSQYPVFGRTRFKNFIKHIEQPYV